MRVAKEKASHRIDVLVALARAAVGAVKGDQVVETCGPTAINLAPEPHRGVDWDAVRRDPVLEVRGRLRDEFF